ncbi:MAG: glycosyltransferase family 2 protein [Candidatus Omnitrophica bacterium]|nr:glycosyltransferase family 2 protein [Candidatus Omnitrophota bacterium]
MKIGVVIPAYKVLKQIQEVILSLPSTVDHIIVVDDKCPQFSGREAQKINDQRLTVLYHQRNMGVGGAVITGYKEALKLGCDIIVKVDGDGQMDPLYIDKLISPLFNDEADYSKGNRFADFGVLRSMPRVRLFGNSILSFMIKITSGYWSVMDPTNGYTAIRRETLEKIDLNKISKRYFFESDMLIHLNIINAVVVDVSIPSKYSGEESSLSVGNTIALFPFMLLKGFARRIFLNYFIYDFNMASVYILLGAPMFLWGCIFGAVQWRDSIIHGTAKPLGTIMLVTLTIVLSFQMLLQAVSIDIDSTPKKRSR